MNSKEQIKDALALLPIMEVINENHRLGIQVRLDRDKVKFKLDEFASSWAYARKNRMPSFFTLFFSGINKDAQVIIDNYCNIIEDGDGLERGECTMVFDGCNLIELHDLN